MYARPPCSEALHTAGGFYGHMLRAALVRVRAEHTMGFRPVYSRLDRFLCFAMRLSFPAGNRMKNQAGWDRQRVAVLQQKGFAPLRLKLRLSDSTAYDVR